MVVAPDLVWAIAGPSGSGKTTLAGALVAESANVIRRVLSCTTRSPREGEVPDRDYRFVSETEFDHLRAQCALFEETRFGGARYGLVASELSGPGEVLVIVDANGVSSLKQALGKIVVAIALCGYEVGELESRLKRRGTAKLDIHRRLRDLKRECEDLAAVCDHQIPRGSPNEVLAAVGAIMAIARVTREKGGG